MCDSSASCKSASVKITQYYYITVNKSPERMYDLFRKEGKFINLIGNIFFS